MAYNVSNWTLYLTVLHYSQTLDNIYTGVIHDLFTSETA